MVKYYLKGSDKVELKKFSQTDFEQIYDFMAPIWYDTYGSILPKEQIDLLLNKYFSACGLAHYRDLGYEYFSLTDDGRKGVVVICERDGDTYLDKLYLTPDSRGKGYASFVFAELLKLGRDITLNVNQGNARAIACYKKNGFVVESEERIPVGDGLINVDFNMRLKKDGV